MEFRILGPLSVHHENTELDLGKPREQVLLSLLVVYANRVVSTDRIVDELWGDDPPFDPVHTIHVYVSRLRQALQQSGASQVIHTQRPGYLLLVDADDVDSLRFERLANEGHNAMRRGEPDVARDKLLEALSLWRGPPLAECLDRRFAEEETPRLERLRLRALEDRLEADLCLGLHADIVEELQDLAARHPTREPFCAQLMLALYRCGRPAEALGAYEEARNWLLTELGVEPGSELQRLKERILTYDSSLAWESPTAEPLGL